ncbi:MAG: hypothetical protein L6R40_003922 [Gallowayella cf. fulva]|nr:MAG: hypothetical protein L6R40_003922 [Xanthomendoza cf. fulva]
MKLTWFPSSPDRIKKYSKQRRQTVVGGGANDEGKRTPALEDQKTTGNWFKDEMGKYSPRRSNAPRTAPDSLPIQTQRNLPRDSYGPTFNPFAQSAVFAPQPPLTTSTSSLVCNEDDALRGLLRFSNEAHTFCPLFLGPRIDGHRLATYIGQYDPAQVSKPNTATTSTDYNRAAFSGVSPVKIQQFSSTDNRIFFLFISRSRDRRCYVLTSERTQLYGLKVETS